MRIGPEVVEVEPREWRPSNVGFKHVGESLGERW